MNVVNYTAKSGILKLNYGWYLCDDGDFLFIRKLDEFSKGEHRR
ncbi:hypothetical protein [Devosia sp. DBB001]|nr:hypothetical protein [Devosia sp. DBB001]